MGKNCGLITWALRFQNHLSCKITTLNSRIYHVGFRNSYSKFFNCPNCFFHESGKILKRNVHPCIFGILSPWFFKKSIWYHNSLYDSKKFLGKSKRNIHPWKIDNKRLSIQQIIHLVACGWNIESLMYFETYYHSHLCNTRAQTDWLDAQCVPWTQSMVL